MARDAAELVRRALAVTLKSLAAGAARRRQPAGAGRRKHRAADAELLAGVHRRGPLPRSSASAARCARWRSRSRPVLTERVTDHDRRARRPEAVEVTAPTNKAQLRRRTALQTVVERFEKSESGAGGGRLPQRLAASVTERLMTLVSGELRDHLISDHDVTAADRARDRDRQPRAGHHRPGRAGRADGRPAGASSPTCTAASGSPPRCCCARSRTAT